jgi:TetR/AcrR family transcriptional regulator
MVRPATGRQHGERTRARILSAARKEFARSGYAGARIDGIARRAGVTKALVFYYFESKDGLSRAVSAQRLATYALPRVEASATREDLFEWPRWLFGRGEESLDAVRFAMGEGIGAELSRTPVFDAEQRRASFQQQVTRVRDAQQAGALPADLDSAQLTFFLYMLGVYPWMLPQGAYLITGAAPDDPLFQPRFEAFIGDLALLFHAVPCGSARGHVTDSATLAASVSTDDDPTNSGLAHNPDLTRARILAAALKEFGQHGFRGSRIDAIARRAGVPRSLIAYYFGTKEGIFLALATERAWSTERVQRQLSSGPDDPFAWSRSLFALGEPTLDWAHLLIWEGLEWEPGTEMNGRELVLEDTRRRFWQRRIASVRTYQAEGELAAHVDPEHLTFFLWVLGMYPYLVPQIAHLITGRWPSDPSFRTDFERFVRAVASRMKRSRGLE